MARRDWYCEDVLSGKMQVQIVFEDERVLGFHHPNPDAQIHVVIIPKIHIESIMESEALDAGLLVSMVRAVQESARKLELDKTGFHVRVNACASGVTPHMHWHLKGPGIPD